MGRARRRERVARPLLLRLLAPHATLLVERHGFSLEALGASLQTDRTYVEALWQLLGTFAADLAPLHDDLLAVADVGTRAGHEALLSLDTAKALDPDLGDADCAAVAFLDHRPLFDAARPQTTGQARTTSFASYASAMPLPLPSDASHGKRFAKAMSGEMVARGRSDHFKMHEWQSGHERHFEIVYGRLATARDLLAKADATDDGPVHVVTRQVTDRSTERTHAIFRIDTFQLDVAGHEWVKETVRRFFGESYFGSATHFRGDETVTLEPLADLETALSVDVGGGVERVELKEVWFDVDGGWVATGARGDCMKGSTGGYARRAFTEGKAVEAVFLLYLTGRKRPVSLKIAAPRKLEFSRENAKTVRIVRDWVVARGYMRVPEHLMNDGAASESSRG
jgi:hypothetical protein